jgi:hypothetical protein
MALLTLSACSASRGASAASRQPSAGPRSSVPTASSAPVLACSKITTGEVSTALGGPVTFTSRTSPVSECIYNGGGAASGEVFSVIRVTPTTDDAVAYRKDMAASSSRTQRVAHLDIGRGALMFEQATVVGGDAYPTGGGRCLVLLQGAPGQLGMWIKSASNLTEVSALVEKALRLCASG